MSHQHKNLKRDQVTSAGLGGDAEEVAQSVRVLAAQAWSSEFGSQDSRGGVLIWNPSLGGEVNRSQAWLQVPQRPDLKGIGVEWQRRHWTSSCGPHVCTGSSQCTCTHTCAHTRYTLPWLVLIVDTSWKRDLSWGTVQLKLACDHVC